MKTLPSLLVPAALAAALLWLSPFTQAEPPATDAAAALEGGTPIPDGAAKVTFPWAVKQSITAISDAEVERMVAIVDFSDPGTEPFGTVTLDGKGGGSGSFKLSVTDLRTGSKERDEHLQGPMWLDKEKTPEISLSISKLERVKPTVYRMTGTWKMHGVEKPLSVLANVRHVAKMEYFGENLARLKAKFELNIADFAVSNPYVGSPSVAKSWSVEMVALGHIQPPK